MSLKLVPDRIRARLLLAGCAFALACWCAAPVKAQPPVASTDLAAAEKIGVTLYQVNGFSGKIPLKKVYKVHPSGDTGHYELEFASSNMKTQMQWKAKLVVPSGMVFKSFEVSTFNGPKQVTPASADSWDGQTIIDEVTLSPWNMNHVLQQCIAQMTNGDGTFKDSATFDLQADLSEMVRGKGIASPANAPPGSSTSYSAQVMPKTRVTAYIVGESRSSEPSRGAGRLKSAQAKGAAPSRIPPTISTPQPGVRPGRLIGKPSEARAKDRFERTKPHVNVSSLPAQTSSERPVQRLKLIRP